MQGENWNDWGVQNSSSNWHPNSVLNGLGSPDFNEFVRNVIEARPGYVSELLFAFTKPGISFIGKTENLRSDLRYVLDQLNLKYDVATIDGLEKKNVSAVSQDSIEWDSDLRQVAIWVELPALLHFDYLTATERQTLGIKMDIPPNVALQRRSENIR